MAKTTFIATGDVCITRRIPKGVTVLSGSEEVLRYMAELSAPYGTEITIENGVGIVRLK